MPNLQFEAAEPGLAAVATWSARGLAAYDAAYVAVAEERAPDQQTSIRKG
ncbi:MAG TPA: hypothetical protein VE669_03975 [Actinomycetota bacterium]|nr:hypothetical protein [Actinomycetota bacterium]